jgi:MFS family permease
MLAPYRTVLSTPGARAFSVAGLMSRLPMSTISLGIVLLVSHRTGSFGTAGVMAAAYTLATAASSPAMARLIDRLGQRRVLVPASSGLAAGIVGLVVAVELGWPAPLPHMFAIAAGVLSPPIGACVRARWSHILEPGPGLHTAFSLEAVVDESVFMLGPVLVTILATQVDETAGLLAVIALALLGGCWLASQHSTEPPVAAPSDTLAPADPLPWGWLTSMVLAAACLGSLFGATEVVTVAFAKEHGHVGVTGALLAIWASGSLIAGLVTGAVSWTAGPLRRYRLGATAMAIVMMPLPFVPNIYVLAVALFLGGFAISPTLVAAMSLIEAEIPASRLTEGISWLSTGIGFGIAPGAAIAGHLVDLYGASPAYLVPAVSGILAAAVALSTGYSTRPLTMIGERLTHDRGSLN